MLFNKDHMNDHVKIVYKEAKAGNIQSAYLLGLCYEQGDGCDKDLEKAKKWIENAADKEWPEAMSYYAYQLYLGDYIPKDDVKAHYYARKAADKKDAFGYFLMGLFYEEGIHCERNPKRALEYFEKGAKLNSSECLYMAGSYLMEGKGCDQDVKKATVYLESAAELGDMDAALCLVNIYTLEKYGVPHREKAYKYGKMCASEGNDDVMPFLKKHEKDFVKGDKQRAKEKKEREEAERRRREEELRQQKEKEMEELRQQYKKEMEDKHQYIQEKLTEIADKRMDLLEDIKNNDIGPNVQWPVVLLDSVVLLSSPHSAWKYEMVEFSPKKVNYFSSDKEQYQFLSREDSLSYKCDPEIQRILDRPKIFPTNFDKLRRYALYIFLNDGFTEHAFPIFLRLFEEGDAYSALVLVCLFRHKNYICGKSVPVEELKVFLRKITEKISKEEMDEYFNFANMWWDPA